MSAYRLRVLRKFFRRKKIVSSERVQRTYTSLQLQSWVENSAERTKKIAILFWFGSVAETTKQFDVKMIEKKLYM